MSNDYNSTNSELISSLQFYVRKTNHNLLEIVDAFNLDKVRIGFRNFNKNGESGNKVTDQVDFYLTIPELELICQDILTGHASVVINEKDQSGKFTYKKYGERFKGSERNGQIYSRKFYIVRSDLGAFFTALEGPGKKEGQGIVKPLYKDNEAPNKVSISITPDDMKTFALQGKRACDYYYNNFFGFTEGTRPKVLENRKAD